MHPNPMDQKWSWVIALACCFVNCLLYGVIRLSGLLLVATVEAFHVSRARAAMPFSVSTSVRNLSGLFVGYFGQKFGLRPVIGTGCLIASFGAGLCFFASDIFWITGCWGVIFGIGCGLGTCLLPLAINQHFEKHRGKASGISYSGSYIGSFVFPPIVVMLLDNYGLNGTFLVISGTLLNGLVASLIFRPKSSNKLEKENAKQLQLESKLTTTELESCTKSIWQKLLHHIKRTDVFLKTEELTKPQELPSIYLIASEPLKNSDGRQHILPLETEFTDEYTNNVENENSNCEEADFKNHKRQTGSRLSRQYAENLYSQSKNELFKGKFKSKYKISIAKLRKTMTANFLKRRYSFNSNLQKVSTDNVKLLSFNNFNCVPCPTLGDKMLHSNPLVHHFNNYDIFLKNNSVNVVYINNREDLTFSNQTSLDKHPHQAVGSFPEPSHATIFTDINFSNSNVSRKREISSGNRGNCNWKIARQNQHRTTLVPSSTSFISKLQASDLKSSNRYKNTSNGDVQSVIRASWQDKFGKCCFGWFQLHARPMFVVIATTMSLHTLVTVCTITIIEDFAKDLHVPDNQVHCALMALSTADLLGALTMGVVADQGIIPRCYFIALCFLGTGVFSIAISFSQNLTTLLTLVAFFGIFETGVIITFPLLIAQFIEVKRQAIALASSNALSSPVVLLVPLIIGYFRDRVGSYSGVFYVLGILSFSSSLIWLTASYFCNKQKKQNRFDFQVPG